MLSLNEAALAAVAERVPVPSYDRSGLRCGIVHIGVGGFHRAHQAMYLDRLMEQGLAHDWAICGVGVLESDRGMKEVLTRQDGLFTLVVKHDDGRLEPRVIGSIREFLLVPDDPDAVVERLAHPETRIVSMTITEGGYNIDPISHRFVDDAPGVVRDLVPGATPATTFGLVVEALARRRERGIAPFTVMSCDNIPGNGDVARASFARFAELRDAELGEFVRTRVRFPNSMVDRITPVTTPDDTAELAERFGLEDGWPVVCESFTQWVLEDDFDERPPLDQVGVQLVEDVEPYELMKLRLLNAGHQAVAYLGYLAGYRLVHEAAQDPHMRAFLLGYMEREGSPTLPPVPGVDLEDYRHGLVSRFSNAYVRDTIARLCAESSDRIPKWLLPVVRENLDRGGEITRSVAVVAAWARYAEGVDEQGQPIAVVDRLSASLGRAARQQYDEPLAFVSDRSLFGDLVDDERFVTAYTSALEMLHSKGSRALLEHLASL